MKPLRKTKSKRIAPATVLYTKTKNESGEKQLCVYAQCQYVGCVVGPIWGHEQRSVNKVMAELTRRCQCGRPFHKIREQQGKKITGFQAKR